MKTNENQVSGFIFLAEDDIDDQELLKEAFAQIDDGITITTANNGKKALNFLESLPEEKIPSLIILDYNLPEISGAEILKKVNQLDRYKDTVKIVWSTSNSPVYEQICLDLGAKAYLVKPNDISGINRMAQVMWEMCVVKRTNY